MSARRLVYRVRLARGKEREKGTWVVVMPDRSLEFWSYKTEAVDEGRALARGTWFYEDRPAQLVVHNRDGRIAFENTYGRDPARRKG